MCMPAVDRLSSSPPSAFRVPSPRRARNIGARERRGNPCPSAGIPPRSASSTSLPLPRRAPLWLYCSEAVSSPGAPGRLFLLPGGLPLRRCGWLRSAITGRLPAASASNLAMASEINRCSSRNWPMMTARSMLPGIPPQICCAAKGAADAHVWIRTEILPPPSTIGTGVGLYSISIVPLPTNPSEFRERLASLQQRKGIIDKIIAAMETYQKLAGRRSRSSRRAIRGSRRRSHPR